MGLFAKIMIAGDRAEFLELASYHCPDIGMRLRQSKARVTQFAKMSAPQWLKISHDCEKLINSTTKPDVFFSRFQLLESVYACMALVEPYVSYRGAAPHNELRKIQGQKQMAVRALIERSYAAMLDQANAMKTEKGRSNKISKFFESFDAYRGQMDEETRAILDALKK